MKPLSKGDQAIMRLYMKTLLSWGAVFLICLVTLFFLTDDIALDERVLSRVQRSSMVKLLYPEAERGKPDLILNETLFNETGLDRMIRLRNVCRSSPELTQTVGTFKQYVVAVEYYRTIMCLPPKVQSSDWKYFLVKLHKYKWARPAFNQKLHKPPTLNEVGIHYMNQLPDDQYNMVMNNYLKVVVVRHPLIRLVLAFQDRFRDIALEWRRKDELGKAIKKAFAPDLSTGEDVTFQEFVRYLINEEDKPHEFEKRWLPLRHACEPCVVNYDVIIKLDSVETDLFHALYSMNVTGHKLPYLPWIFHQDKPLSDYMDYYTEITEPQYEAILKIYHSDFTMFGYIKPPYPGKIPSVYDDSVVHNNI